MTRFREWWAVWGEQVRPATLLVGLYLLAVVAILATPGGQR